MSKQRDPNTVFVLSSTQPVELKVDPGSKTTGMALVGVFPKQGRVVLWAANLAHRGAVIRKRLEDRRSLRRGRRGRKTRYREPRFDNRTKPRGWLPLSLRSRVENVRVWYGRLLGRIPITEAHIETVRFDMHAMQRPGISGVEYQQGTLVGYEVREYLLEKWNRTCAYCGAKDVPLEVEHIEPRSEGCSRHDYRRASSGIGSFSGETAMRTRLPVEPQRRRSEETEALAPSASLRNRA